MNKKHIIIVSACTTLIAAISVVTITNHKNNISSSELEISSQTHYSETTSQALTSSDTVTYTTPSKTESKSETAVTQNELHTEVSSAADSQTSQIHTQQPATHTQTTTQYSFIPPSGDNGVQPDNNNENNDINNNSNNDNYNEPVQPPQQTKPQAPSPQPETTTQMTLQESMDFQNEILSLVNQARSENGLPSLSLDTALCSAAQVRAEEIVQAFSHSRPDGSSCFTVFDQFGISPRTMGENIAAGQKSAAEVMNGWMNSEGHRANILNSSFKSIGVGLYKTSSGYGY